MEEFSSIPVICDVAKNLNEKSSENINLHGCIYMHPYSIRMHAYKERRFHSTRKLHQELAVITEASINKKSVK